MPYKDSELTLPGIYYAWAENILEKSKMRLLENDPRDGSTRDDVQQDMVLNVNLGLSSYGYLNIYQQI